MEKTEIHSGDFGSIPRWKDIIKTLPEEARICPIHGAEVNIRLGESLPHQDSGAAFSEAHWEGCCEEAIDSVLRRVQEKLVLIDRAKQTYTERLAPKLEPEHTGEIVAIELGTNDYFIGENEVDAADRARAAGHEGALFFLRVGSPYAHRVMTPRR